MPQWRRERAGPVRLDRAVCNRPVHRASGLSAANVAAAAAGHAATDRVCELVRSRLAACAAERPPIDTHRVRHCAIFCESHGMRGNICFSIGTFGARKFGTPQCPTIAAISKGW